MKLQERDVFFTPFFRIKQCKNLQKIAPISLLYSSFLFVLCVFCFLLCNCRFSVFSYVTKKIS